MDLLNMVVGGTGSVLLAVVSFLVVLTVVVFVHEFGHFWVGRLCGVGVQAFSIGFGRELVGWTDRHGTRWKISAIPLGGYVKFVGDANAASMPDRDALGHLTQEQRELSFPHKSVAKRAAIVAAGPIANFLLAIAILTGLAYFNGRYVLEPRVHVVQPGSAAERAGLRPQDLVLSINGRTVESFLDVQRMVSGNAGETLTIVVDRGGRTETLQAVPDLVVDATPFGKQRIGRLGVQPSLDRNAVKLVHYSPWGALKAGVFDTWYVIERTIDVVGKLITGRESADQLSGPLGIAWVSGEVASQNGAGGLISLVALISISIGLINLFPIPILDGGHLLFYAVEAVRGRPLSERAQEIGYRIGFAVVVMLMIFSTWNDILRFIEPFLAPGT
ncbi:MAG TPA: RIP metalloprotease RseP [Microvirga sp.]|jgi:regulator of sigma E protease|nr:RIP metalloprotease RseP [Microvirga sp.]